MKATIFPSDGSFDYFDADPAQVASRVSSLTIAAQLVMSGDSLCDKLLTETVCMDLLSTAAWMSRALENHLNRE
jgi:hypothetical protein